MTKPIGPTFIAELTEAGLLGLPFTWDAAGDFTYEPSMTTGQVAAVAAVYAAHDPTKLTPQMMFDAVIAGGLAITSTGTPAINGTYAIDQTTQSKIVAESLYIQVTGKFTNGQTTKAWADLTGVPHTFTTTEFTPFAEAVGQFVDPALTALAVAEAGGSPTWPTPAATIA